MRSKLSGMEQLAATPERPRNKERGAGTEAAKTPRRPVDCSDSFQDFIFAGTRSVNWSRVAGVLDMDMATSRLLPTLTLRGWGKLNGGISSEISIVIQTDKFMMAHQFISSRSNSNSELQAPTPPRRLAFNKRQQHSHNLGEYSFPAPSPPENTSMGPERPSNVSWASGANFGEGAILTPNVAMLFTFVKGQPPWRGWGKKFEVWISLLLLYNYTNIV
ncbi:hypothetical protein C8R44DRAFT_748404 [Mycena epipterygia]|nr:hypothetical protein C8R44DRAFT_748404 [Mycena epipterygia]